MATNINNKLVCNEPHANLDSYYGPYNTVHAAYVALADTTVNGINYTKKHIGLTVGVWKDSSHTEIVEYWFKGGLSESNLVEKTSDAGLPGGVKIVTFDKNGGSGAQNSLITDTDGNLMLPECTLTKTGETFQKWVYNNVQYDEGDVITIGSSTVVQTQWSSSPTPKKYTITWVSAPGNGITAITGKVNGTTTITSPAQVNEGDSVELKATVASGYTFDKWINAPVISSTNTLLFTVTGNASNISASAIESVTKYSVVWAVGSHITITGEANGRSINNGATLNAGTVVILTATPDSGYTFKSWLNKPSGATETGNKLTFTLNSNVSNVTATAEPTVVKYTIGWSGSNVTINATDGNNTPLTNGSQYASGTTVKMTAQADAGYDFEKWEGVPNSVADPTQSSITFTLDNNYQNIVAKTKATPVESGFYYYGCGSTNGAKGNITGGEGEGENGNEGESGNEGGTTTKWFTIEEIMRGEVKSDSVLVKNTDGNTIYYVLTKTNTKPTYTVDGETKDFVELQKCGDNEIINHFNSLNWVFAETNQITGQLQTQTGCNYIFIVINELLKNKTFTISI